MKNKKQTRRAKTERNTANNLFEIGVFLAVGVRFWGASKEGVPRQGPKTKTNDDKHRGRRGGMKKTCIMYFGDTTTSLCQFLFGPEDDKHHPQKREKNNTTPKEEWEKQHHPRGGWRTTNFLSFGLLWSNLVC